MNSAELNQLIDELLDGVCSEADFLRLEAELHVNPEARKTYYARLKLHTALQLDSVDRTDSEKSKVIPFVQFKRQLPWIAGIAAAVLIWAAGGLGWQLGRGGQAGEVIVEEPVAMGFGVLAEQSDAVWADHRLRRGDLLPQGLVKLKSGIAQLELFSGVTVILEGNAEFEVHSAMEMSVNSGKLRAIVPEPAQGFRVKTASGDLVDLGTEFAIDVTPEHADLHVFDGEIEWHPTSESVSRLIDGESMRWTADGERGDMLTDPEQFPGVADMRTHRSLRREQWARHSRELQQDSRLLAYFAPEPGQESSRSLIDKSASRNNGVIVRAKTSENRWEAPNSALDFSPMGSRVRLAISGEHEALTFYCWARIDSLDRWFNSLFLTDGHELQEPHWQIMNDGRLFFSVKKQEGGKGRLDKHVAYSPPIWTPALSGQWMQIATVYNGSAGTTTHYLNGEQISHDQLSSDMIVSKVRIGAASIGNWSEPMREDPHFAVRNLNGAIDEFAIFAAALSAQEIHELYQKGRP
ncbi:MAG: LamG-like jellyroll fold domain-containing protein [Verrucomicrobiota bacterium]